MNKDKPLKAVFIFIDNFDVVKEMPGNFEEFITKVTRDGFGLGIYTIITATRSNAVRFSTLNNFKNKIAQYMFDDGDAMNLIGRSKYKLNDDIKGRALVKDKTINMMQVYAPVVGEDDMEVISNLKTTVNDIREQYKGDKLLSIPVLPEVFTTLDFANYACESENKNLIGLSLDNVENVSLEITSSPYLIVGPSKSGKTNYLEILLSQFKGRKYVFDSDEMTLYKYKDITNYITTEEEVTDFIEQIMSAYEGRKMGLKAALNSDEFSSPREYYKGLEPITIFIDDVDVFVQKLSKIPDIAKVLEQITSVGIHIVAGVNPNKLKGYDEVTKFIKTSTTGAVLGQIGSFALFTIATRDTPMFGNAVLCNNGNQRTIRVPRFVEVQGEV